MPQRESFDADKREQHSKPYNIPRSSQADEDSLVAELFSQKRVQKHHGSELGNAADGHEDSVLTIVSNVILKQIYRQICHM